MSFRTCIYLVVLPVVCGSLLIPKHDLGFVYKNGKSHADVKIKLFVDLLCPKSKDVFHTLMETVESYKNDQVQLKTHLVPLPYHVFAFMASKTVHAVSMLTGDKETYKWMGMVFSNMSWFAENANSMTQRDIIPYFADMVETLAVDNIDFTRLCCCEMQVLEDAVIGWKYSCSRGVHSVPWIMINDMTVDAEEWSVDDWKTQLDTLLDKE